VGEHLPGRATARLGLVKRNIGLAQQFLRAAAGPPRRNAEAGANEGVVAEQLKRSSQLHQHGLRNRFCCVRGAPGQ